MAASRLVVPHMAPGSPNAYFGWDLGLETRQQFHEKTPKRGKKNEIGGEEGRKTRIFPKHKFWPKEAKTPKHKFWPDSVWSKSVTKRSWPKSDFVG